MSKYQNCIKWKCCFSSTVIDEQQQTSPVTNHGPAVKLDRSVHYYHSTTKQSDFGKWLYLGFYSFGVGVAKNDDLPFHKGYLHTGPLKII